MKNLRSIIFLAINLLVLCTPVFISHIPFVFTKDVTVAAMVSCISKERQALMEFKASMIDRANRLSSWTGDDCCINWIGITCNNVTGHVEKLDLHNPIQYYVDPYTVSNNYSDYTNNQLRGMINPSICNLKHLRYLDLSSNDFSNILIPTFFGSLNNLRYLNLSNSQLTGEIPPHFGNLSNLQYLDIGQNSLSAKSLKWIIGFTSLKYLDLSETNLTESFDWLSSVNMLPFLSSLHLRACQLRDSIDVSHPLSHLNLTSLVLLDLGKNQFDYNLSTVFRFFNLTASKLQVLKLESTTYDFGDPIPLMLERFTSLTILDINSNNFNSSLILDSLCNRTSLIYVDISWNLFGGSLPPCLGNLTSLEVMNLQGNYFVGKIPIELGNLNQLTSLYLSFNRFNSSIPSSFGKLTNLRSLHLNSNLLFDTIPPSLSQLTRLEELYTTNNLLTGQLFDSFFNKLKYLKVLDISDFSLNINSQWIPPFQLSFLDTDSVDMVNDYQFPPWLQYQRNIIVLSMINASISGAIPEWFGTFGSRTLKNLILRSNKIDGSIPNSLCNLSSLTMLDLSNNQLTGRIPLCFGSLWQLHSLNLAGNKLNGVLPSSLKSLTYVSYLDLCKNNFSGTIPEWIGQELSQLRWLFLQSNSFFGILPSSMKNLIFLQELDLSENNFTGTIPEWIGQKLSQLTVLKLESNKFHSNIPINLCELSNLKQLRLGHNELTGYIPNC